MATNSWTRQQTNCRQDFASSILGLEPIAARMHFKRAALGYERPPPQPASRAIGETINSGRDIPVAADQMPRED